MKTCRSQTYDDIISFPHPVSRLHPPMARSKRAAQFAAFDALAGFGAAITEAGRETEEKKELSDDMIDTINVRLAMIQHQIEEHPIISVTYFVPDKRKAGGRYTTVAGNVKALDRAEKAMIMMDETRIPIKDIGYLEGDIFD